MFAMSFRYEFFAKDVAKAFMQATDIPSQKAATLVEKDAKASMKSGGRETGSRGGKVRKPSRPGDPPHVQTGNLRASITFGKTDRGTYIVGPTLQAWYGRLHEQPEKPLSPGAVAEYGGRSFPQRPFMRPALYRMARKFKRLFRSLGVSHTAAGRKLNARRNR